MRQLILALLILYSVLTQAISLSPLETFHAQFQQVTFDQNTRELLFKTQGEVWFKQPYYYRWVLGSPVQSIALKYTQDSFWVIEPPLFQATQYRSAEHLAAQIPLWVLSEPKQLKKHFKIKSLKSKPLFGAAYQLHPKQPMGFLDHLVLYLKGGRLSRLMIYQTTPHLIQVTFQNPEYNLKINHELFELKIPSDYDKISFNTRSAF
ncbi:MAG: hypothetical protein CMF51_00125 [Legionellales bacterium]|nr:hypothetical protein [Legionellales bacterium]|tara:strand:+ start:1484 stop:2101 length:618 start_codon:yes stop_codon:yes gene_type:complete